MDVYSLFGCGIVVAIIAVITGILWERRVGQNRTKVAKAIQARSVAHSEPEMARENGSSSPSNRLAERLLQNSKKVLSGSPSVYELPMKTEFKYKENMITRQSIGGGFSHPESEKTEKVFLVVGARGSGKTTLINGMVNYILGVEWKDDFRYKLASEDQTESQGQCQTKDITAYTFYPMEGSAVPYTFTIIDTPGFRDSEELEEGKTTKKQIEEFLSLSPPGGIDHLDGIGFVTQASLTGLTLEQEYIFDIILSIFGKDVVRNMFTMVTFADCQSFPPVMDAIKKADVIPSQKYYKFDNWVLFAGNIEETEIFNEKLWKMGFSSLKTLFEELETSESVSLQFTGEVLKENGKRTTTSSHTELQMSPGKSALGTGVVGPSSSLPKILKNSEKVSSGSPSVYKLPTKTALQQQKGMIVRKSVDSPDKVVGNGTEKVLLVVGASGAGKTTLINGMVNYILGVQWKDDFRYKLIIEDEQVSQASSQTKHITAYTFYPMKGSAVPYTFTIIDTPGFGDTEGLERDRQITDQIKEFFSVPPPDGISHLDGIGFVTQASLARLTPTQEYIFDSILSIFGKDVARNIFILVTFADGQKPPVMDAIKKANIPSQKYYKFNNSALFADNTDDLEESFDAMFWKMVFRSFKNFFVEFEKSESVSLHLTQEVLKEREQLQNLIEGLSPQITMGLGKIEEMRQEENILKQHVTDIETNKSFTYTVEISKPYEENLRGSGIYTTTCLRCNFTCHESCVFANDDDKSHCCAMKHGSCTVCKGHCHWSHHKNLPYIIRYKKDTETRTSEDLKSKYETALSGKTKTQGMIDKLEEYLVNVHTTVMEMIVKAQGSLRRLDEIALKPNPLTQLQYLELLIESEKNEAKPGWKQRVQYFEEAKRQAEILSKVKDVKAAEREIKERSRSGEKWYSRFKFW